jgi:hypothetical protein
MTLETVSTIFTAHRCVGMRASLQSMRDGGTPTLALLAFRSACIAMPPIRSVSELTSHRVNQTIGFVKICPGRANIESDRTPGGWPTDAA